MWSWATAELCWTPVTLNLLVLTQFSLALLQPCHTKQHVKMWPICSLFSRGTDWAAWTSEPTHRTQIRGTICGGDELGKLHNIFIRYNFTCLVDELQGDTLQINSEPRWLTRANLTKRSITKPNEQLTVPFTVAWTEENVSKLGFLLMHLHLSWSQMCHVADVQTRKCDLNSSSLSVLLMCKIYPRPPRQFFFPKDNWEHVIFI